MVVKAEFIYYPTISSRQSLTEKEKRGMNEPIYFALPTESHKDNSIAFFIFPMNLKHQCPEK